MAPTLHLFGFHDQKTPFSSNFVQNDPEKQVVYLCSHGIAGNYQQVFNYAKSFQDDGQTWQNEHFILDEPFAAFNYPDATQRFWRINFWNTSLAQGNELVYLQKAYTKLVEQIKNQGKTPEIVLVGCSRGAAAIINFVGIMRPKYVKALILESPFDTQQAPVTGIINRIGLAKFPGLSSAAYRLMPLAFFKHKPHLLRPIDRVDRIPKDIPILIISSQEDTLVPTWSTKNLYLKLRDTGHQKTHYLPLKYGRHGYLIFGKSGFVYQNVTHAFYAQYDLPHDHKLAEFGMHIFTKLQKNAPNL